MEYLKTISQDEQSNVCIDFDGVIHNDYKGFGDGTIYGNIIDGASDAIKTLSEKYKIIILTAKAKPDRPLVNGKTGADLIWEWLETHNINQYITDVTSEKPRAVVYIDDKAIRFENWKTALDNFKEIYETQ